MASYRCYYKKFGPLTLKVRYSSFSGRFDVTLFAAFDTIVHELYRECRADVGEDDADLLRKFEYEAKKVIRSWAAK